MVRAVLLSAAVVTLLFTTGDAVAQTSHSHQPYAALQSRPVKALSEEQIADLRAGRGMGLALGDQLNGYPGPKHVLENADRLGLSPGQRQRTEALFEAMKAETVTLGERLIAQETELDRLFASKTVTPASLEDATRAIGETQATLRAAHLRYHLAMMEALTPEQVRRYGELRGYVGPTPQDHGGHAAPAR